MIMWLAAVIDLTAAVLQVLAYWRAPRLCFRVRQARLW
jgi:hypothetical protein